MEEAQEYLEEVKKTVAAKEAAEWEYVEHAKFEASLETSYQVGDTVYLEGDPYTITEVNPSSVQLLPPDLLYPIYRAESRENFERLLKQDKRNTTVISSAEPDHFIDHYYVVDNLQVQGALNLKEYSTFNDAIRAYQSLPADKMKALGVQNTRNPLPGSLDLLQCIDREDKVVQDYTKVDD